MHKELTYKAFQQQEEFEKIALLESFHKEDAAPVFTHTRNLKRFFIDLLFDESGNNFLKLKALKILLWLTSKQQVSEAFTLDTYLDVASNDPFILSQKIKGLFLLCHTESQFIEFINESKESEHMDVASEAYYTEGLRYFFDTTLATNLPNVLNVLGMAKGNFEMAVKIAENRIDAEIFLECSEMLISILGNAMDQSEAHFSELGQKLFEYQYKSLDGKLPHLDAHIYQCLSSLYEIAKSTNSVESWYDYRSQLSALNQHFLDFFEKEADNKTLDSNILSPWKEHQNSSLLRPLIRNKLQSKAIAVGNLRNNLTEEEDELKVFLDNLLDETSKKKDEGQFVNKALLYTLFPKIDRYKIDDLCGRLDFSQDELELVCQLIIIQENQLLDELAPEEKEIFGKLKFEIEQEIPGISASKLAFYETLKGVIRYVKVGFEERGNVFEVLYGKSNASEDDFQQSLYTFLLAGRSSKFKSETPQYADGGRIDLSYTTDKSNFPIEVKKTNKVISRQIIRNNFLPQAQAYVAPNNQLGIFVLFDITDKSKAVLPNIRNLFWIESLKPTYNLPIDYPDLVVVVVVPANKVSPSSKSKYG